MQEVKNKKLPTLKQLVDGFDLHNDSFSKLVNQEPPKEWIKTHPKIEGHKYLPINKIEYLLRNILYDYRIEILREGDCYNGVFVSIRLHYKKYKNTQWSFHDGIGATQLELKNGIIVENSLSPSFPLSETLAIKDASEKFGKLFGSDLNREITINEKKAKIRITKKTIKLP